MASNSVKQTLLSEAFFFSMDTTTPEIYTLSLHDALPIFQAVERADGRRNGLALEGTPRKRSTLPRDAGAEEREEHERSAGRSHADNLPRGPAERGIEITPLASKPRRQRGGSVTPGSPAARRRALNAARPAVFNRVQRERTGAASVRARPQAATSAAVGASSAPCIAIAAPRNSLVRLARVGGAGGPCRKNPRARGRGAGARDSTCARNASRSLPEAESSAATSARAWA